MRKSHLAAAHRIEQHELTEALRRAQLRSSAMPAYLTALRRVHKGEHIAALAGWDDPLFQPQLPLDDRVGYSE